MEETCTRYISDKELQGCGSRISCATLYILYPRITSTMLLATFRGTRFPPSSDKCCLILKAPKRPVWECV